MRDLLGRAFRHGEQLAFPEATTASEHWQRVVMNDAIDRYIASLDPPRRTAAEISGDAHGGKPWKSHCSLNYPEFDLCAPIPEDLKFDVVICEQVLEHVVNPWVAAANLRQLCLPGGYVIVDTPFLIKVHELPLFMLRDYWRFTPRGLRTLLEQVGFEVETVGAWGNQLCVVGNFNRWSSYRPWHSLRNQDDVPVVVWAFGRNPG